MARDLNLWPRHAKHFDKTPPDATKLDFPTLPGEEARDQYDLTKLPAIRLNCYLWYRTNKVRYQKHFPVDLVRGFRSMYKDATAGSNDLTLRQLNNMTAGFFAMFDAGEVAAFERDHPDVKAKVDAALDYMTTP